MTRRSTELFKKRSATNEFLLNRSDDPDVPSFDGVVETRSELDNGWSAARFADMLDREGLVAAIGSTFGDIARLCVVAVRIEASGAQDAMVSGDQPLGRELADSLDPLAAVCHDHGGVWARLGRCRFAFAFAHVDPKGGRRLAARMQQAVARVGTAQLTAGIAAYPTTNDAKTETIGNAEKALEHAAFFGPGSIIEFDAVSLNISGDRLYQNGDIRGAINEFRRGLRLAPTNTNLLNSLGVCYGVLHDYAKALDAFETVIWLDPEEMMAVYNKGFVKLCQGRREEALALFLAADALEPGVFEVVFHIGQIYMEAGAAHDARPYLEAATRANNRSGPAHRQLGGCLKRLGLTKEAIQAYKAVVKMNPEDAAALSILGRLYAQRGESLDVASVLCEQSVQIDPDNGLYRYRLGRVYLEQGRLDTALAEFELASALGHDSRAKIAETQDRMIAAKAS